MMTKYMALVKTSLYWKIEIEADDEHEARATAPIADINFNNYDDISTEVIEVKEVSDD
jgi:hypothetical protein